MLKYKFGIGYSIKGTNVYYACFKHNNKITRITTSDENLHIYVEQPVMWIHHENSYKL